MRSASSSPASARSYTRQACFQQSRVRQEAAVHGGLAKLDLSPEPADLNLKFQDPGCVQLFKWPGRRDSNPGPLDPQSSLGIRGRPGMLHLGFLACVQG